MKILHKVGLGFATAVLSVGGAIVGTAPAFAGGLEVFGDECNSSASDKATWNYDIYNPHIGNFLGPGSCRNQLASYEKSLINFNSVRVDVDNEVSFGAVPDINSYVPGGIDIGYDTCRENSENQDANPDNDWKAKGYRYKNYTDDNCNGNY